MPLNFVDISASPYLQWGTVLEHVADCIAEQIKPDVTGARIYPYWVYEVDHNTLLGKLVDSMRADSGTSEGKVHCWTLGIQSVSVLTNQAGQDPMVGSQGGQTEWVLQLDVWCIREYDGTKATQQAFLNEVRLVGAGLARNTDIFVTEVPEISFAGRPVFTALQPTPFSNGSQYSVAAGIMPMQVRETLIP